MQVRVSRNEISKKHTESTYSPVMMSKYHMMSSSYFLSPTLLTGKEETKQDCMHFLFFFMNDNILGSEVSKPIN